uniref:Uncharacterized protein n=1 Tax=viral metagenome TaxID=1070528 RepID=A0A6M3X430_9ZZZZ
MEKGKVEPGPPAPALGEQEAALLAAGFKQREDQPPGRYRRLTGDGSNRNGWPAAQYHYIRRNEYKGKVNWNANCYDRISWVSPKFDNAIACLAFAEVEGWGQ